MGNIYNCTQCVGEARLRNEVRETSRCQIICNIAGARLGGGLYKEH